MTMGHEIIRIRLPVPTDIRPVGIQRIRPPIVTFRIEVVHIACTTLCDEGSNRYRLFLQIRSCAFQYPLFQNTLYVVFTVTLRRTKNEQ